MQEGEGRQKGSRVVERGVSDSNAFLFPLRAREASVVRPKERQSRPLQFSPPKWKRLWGFRACFPSSLVRSSEKYHLRN